MRQLRRARRPARRGRSPARSPRPPRDGDTEQRILDAAHAVFVRHGTAGARMQDIAQEAGVNQALLHYYFRSKDRLSEAVFQRAAGQLFPQVIQVLGADTPLDAKVRQVVEIEIDRLSKAPYLPAYIISELHHHPERLVQLLSSAAGVSPDLVRSKIVPVVARQIDRAAADRRVRPIAPEQLLVNLLSLCIFPFAARPLLMAMLGLDDAGFGRFVAERRRELADFVLRALKP